MSDLVDITGELIAPFETDMAYHFYDGISKVWLPKSQCEWDHLGIMTMPMWLAIEKGLV